MAFQTMQQFFLNAQLVTARLGYLLDSFCFAVYQNEFICGMLRFKHYVIMHYEIRGIQGLLAYSTKSFVPVISQFMLTVHSNNLLWDH